MGSDSSKQGRLIIHIFQLFDKNDDLQSLYKYIQVIIKRSVGHSEIFSQNHQRLHEHITLCISMRYSKFSIASSFCVTINLRNYQLMMDQEDSHTILGLLAYTELVSVCGTESVLKVLEFKLNN